MDISMDIHIHGKPVYSNADRLLRFLSGCQCPVRCAVWRTERVLGS